MKLVEYSEIEAKRLLDRLTGKLKVKNESDISHHSGKHEGNMSRASAAIEVSDYQTEPCEDGDVHRRTHHVIPISVIVLYDAG